MATEKDLLGEEARPYDSNRRKVKALESWVEILVQRVTDTFQLGAVIPSRSSHLCLLTTEGPLMLQILPLSQTLVS